MPKISFDAIFERKKDKLITRQKIRVGGVTVEQGINIMGLHLGGIDFYKFGDKELEFKTDKEIIVITGIY